MHCAINAICENVPTLFLSYSQKSVGMCKYVYGSEKWVLKLSDLNASLVSRAKELLGNRNIVSKLLADRNAEIQKYISINKYIMKAGDKKPDEN